MKAYFCYLAGLIVGFTGGVWFCKIQEICRTLNEMSASLEKWRR